MVLHYKNSHLKVYLLTTILTVICILGYHPSSIHASALSPTVVNKDTTIPRDYAFTPQVTDKTY